MRAIPLSVSEILPRLGPYDGPRWWWRGCKATTTPRASQLHGAADRKDDSRVDRSAILSPAR
jgi:hypothetical protein